MTQSMDNIPLDQPSPSREATKRTAALSESDKADDPGNHLQGRATHFRQASRSDNIQPYPETLPYMVQSGNYGHLPSGLSMGSIAAALPGYHPHMQQQHFVPAATGHGPVYGMHQFQSFPGGVANPNIGLNSPFPQMYMPYVQQQHQDARPHNTPGFQVFIPNSPGALGITVSAQPGYYNQNIYAATHENPHGFGGLSASVHRRGQLHPTTAKVTQSSEKESKQSPLNLEYDVTKTIVDGSTHMRAAPMQSVSTDTASRTSSPIKPITPRGPPRKPKQSGHALWVGNLAPGTTIVDLKDYFSQDATKDLESVFLISKSNCAFVNYKTEAACLEALTRFHDTRFRGARLVCRVRRGLVAPGPNSDVAGSPPSMKEGEEITGLHMEEEEDTGKPSNTRVPNRYFIVKSLTIEDLEMSRQSGIWATQTHNEDNLNQAYENADNVYLIFSANKSGEYYGYARMMSPIKEDESLTLEMPPRPDHLFPDPEDLDVIATPATSSAPNGRIINDTARGTIFWEADTSSEDEDHISGQKNIPQAAEEPVADGGLQVIGKPFRIRWLSTEKVPFHRTRGLRNPWNANREVKIARDGTELEPSVGDKLVLLFHPEATG